MQSQHGPRRGFSLIELSIVLVVVSLLATVALTEFRTFLTRSKRAEVTANLRAVGRLEMMYEQDRRAFTPYVQELGFAPERGNRYAYLLKEGCSAFQDRSATTLATGPTQTCIGVDTFKFAGATAIPPTTLAEDANDTELLVTAVANIDTDGELDQWSVSSNARSAGAASTDTTCASGSVAAYEPCEDLGDL